MLLLLREHKYVLLITYVFRKACAFVSVGFGLAHTERTHSPVERSNLSVLALKLGAIGKV